MYRDRRSLAAHGGVQIGKRARSMVARHGMRVDPLAFI